MDRAASAAARSGSAAAAAILAPSYQAGTKLWELAPNPVDLLVVEGAGHYEMYDEPRYVSQAIERLTTFCRKYL